MALVQIAAFEGEFPKRSPMLLSDTQAQVAINCELSRGHLEPLKLPLFVTGFSENELKERKTIFKKTNNAGWLAWEKPVNVVKSAVFDADSEAPLGHIFITGDGKPKQMLVDDTEYPLGLPRPTKAPTLKLIADTEAADNEQGDQSSAAYVYTYVRVVDENGIIKQESAPSPAAGPIDVIFGEKAVQVKWPAIQNRESLHITHVRIYRSVVGNTTVEYQYVDEVEASETTYIDRTPDVDMTGDTLKTLLWDSIPDDAKGLIKTDNGIYAAFHGNELLISEPFIPYAFPESYRITVEDTIVALGHTDNTIIVLTTGRPYTAIGSEPESLQINHLPIEQSCVSARGVVMVPGGVIYPSPDGLMMFTSNEQSLITENIFTREQWQELKPETILAEWHDGRYVAFFEGTSLGFLFRPGDEGVIWIKLDFRWEVHSLYHDSRDDCIYLSAKFENENGIYKFNEGLQMEYRWMSKPFFTSRNVSMSAVRIISNHSSETTVKIFSEKCNRDDPEKQTLTISDNRTKRLVRRRAENLWAIEVSGKSEIYEIRMGNSVEEVENGN